MFSKVRSGLACRVDLPRIVEPTTLLAGRLAIRVARVLRVDGAGSLLLPMLKYIVLSDSVF
jgi:hypothetical protein